MKIQKLKVPKQLRKPANKDPAPFLLPMNSSGGEENYSTDSSTFFSIKQSNLNTSFQKEFNKASPTFKFIYEKNPIKSRNPSPISFACQRGLPFRRRCRSSSPPKDGFAVTNKQAQLFPQNRPVVAQRDHKFSALDGLSALALEKECEEDEDLRTIKEQYCRMLQDAPGIPMGDDEVACESSEDESPDTMTGIFNRRLLS